MDGMDPHIAALVGLDLNDPEDVAAIAKAEAEDAAANPTPERDGCTLAIYLPPGVPEQARDELFDRVADATHAAEDGQPYDIHVAGQAGDPLHIWTEPET